MNIKQILKEELENNIITKIIKYLNTFGIPKLNVFDNSGNLVDVKYFVPVGDSISVNGYNEAEVANFPGQIATYLQSIGNDGNIMITKMYESRVLYRGVSFNELGELEHYATQHKVEEVFSMEKQDLVPIEKLIPDFKIEKSKDDVTYPQELLSKLELENGMVTLYHYGDHDLEDGVLDPKHYKKNAYTSDTYGQPRVFFYINKNDKERIVSGKEYIVKVPLKDIYPFNSDPLNFYNDAVKEYGSKNLPVARQVIYITASVLKYGFKAMFFAWENTFRVDYFFPIKPLNS